MLANQTLMVLGGSLNQLPYINEARRLGIRTLCLDMYPDPPGKAAADIFVQCNTRDHEAALEIARSHQIDGVIAAETDVAVVTQAIIANELGLVGPPIEACRILTDKRLFREFRERHSLPNPTWMAVDTVRRPTECPLDTPFVLKPNRSSGGRGAARIDDLNGLQSVWDEWDDTIRKDGAIAETWVDGRQLTFEGFLRDGKFDLAVVTDRAVAPAPNVATVGHFWPVRLEAEDLAAIRGSLTTVLREAGVSDGPVNADLVLSGQGEVTLLEISPRTGGNHLADLVPLATGTAYRQAVLLHTLRETYTLSPTTEARSAIAILILGANTRGRLIVDEDALAESRLLAGVELVALHRRAGDVIECFRSGRDGMGAIIVSGDNRAELEDRVAQAKQALRIRITKEAAS